MEKDLLKNVEAPDKNHPEVISSEFNHFDSNNKEDSSTPEKKHKKKKKKKEMVPISYSQELLRKSIHLMSLSIPVSYIFFSQLTALLILIPMTIACIAIDVLSKKDNIVGLLLNKYFGKMLRKHEKKKKKLILNGASWVLISACMTVFIFPKIIAVTAFAILIISDTSAALIGRKYGKTPLFKNKSWEGTSAFAISAILVVCVLGCLLNAPMSYYIAGIIGALTGSFVEAYSKKIKMDDNFSIPLSVGIVMWGIGNNLAHVMASFIGVLR